MILIENNNDAVRTTTGKSYDYKITLKIMMVNSFLFSFIICLSYKKTYNHAKKEKDCGWVIKIAYQVPFPFLEFFLQNPWFNQILLHLITLPCITLH